MLAEIVDHVVGVDPDRDSVTLAVVDAATKGLVAVERFPTDRDGYRDAISWADGYSVDTERAWAVEGTASYGRGLSAALAAHGEHVIEFDRAEQKPTKDGAKSDELDAERAAREILGRSRLHEPRRHDGHREAIRVHTVARAAAVRARTAAINELKALVVTAGDELRDVLRGRTTSGLIARCAALRDTPRRDLAQRCTRASMRALARRVRHLDHEIAGHDAALKGLVDQAAPQLVAQTGIGYITAAQFFIAWSHPGRCRNEAAYARLAGAAPIPATSGQDQTRHRLNRGGDRQLNTALHTVAITRLRCDPTTRAYQQRRLAEGKTERDIRRCLKRYIARQVWRLLEHQSPLDKT